MVDLDAIYSTRGPLARAVKGFRARPFHSNRSCSGAPPLRHTAADAFWSKSRKCA